MKKDKDINKMILQSDNVRLNTDVFWFDKSNQNKLVFYTAQQLVIQQDYKPREAVKIAQELANEFYNTIITKTTKQ